MSDPTTSVLLTIHFFPGIKPLVITGWKLVGYAGAFMFGGRWIVQAIASRFAKKPVMPIMFWHMSILGSLMLLAYYIWGCNGSESVGILQNLPPAFFAAYNIFLEYRHRAALKTNS